MRYNWSATNLAQAAADPNLDKKLSNLNDKEASAVIQAIRDLVRNNPDLIEKKVDVVAKEKPHMIENKSSIPVVALGRKDNGPTDSKIKIDIVENKENNKQPSKSEEQRPMTSDSAVTGIDLAALDKDRQQFLGKISALEQTLHDQTSSIDKLKEKAERLEQERVASLLQKAQIQSQSRTSQKIIATLIEDRNLATQELEKITKLYQNHIDKEKSAVCSRIDKLSEEIVKTKRESQSLELHQEPVQRILHQSVSAPSSSSQNNRRHQRSCNDSDSDLDSVVDMVKPATTAAVQGGNLPRTALPSRVEMDRTMTEGQKQVIEHIAAIEAPAARVLNLQAFLQTNLHKETDLWKRILDKYKIDVQGLQDTILTISNGVGDTRQLLMQVASAWLHVGRRISKEAYSEESIKGTSLLALLDWLYII